MVQEVKVLLTKLMNLVSILRTPVVEGEDSSVHTITDLYLFFMSLQKFLCY